MPVGEDEKVQNEKPQDEKPEGKDQAEAATQEVEENPEPRTITVRDKEFPIPNKQPADILFAARAISRASRTGDEDQAVEAMMDMAVAYIGEENLRGLLAGQDLEDGMAIVEEVLSSASEAYGSTTGE